VKFTDLSLQITPYKEGGKKVVLEIQIQSQITDHILSVIEEFSLNSTLKEHYRDVLPETNQRYFL